MKNKVWKKPKLVEFVHCNNCGFKVKEDKKCLVCGSELYPYSVEHFEDEAKKYDDEEAREEEE